jgi:hypothetical protein
VTEILFDRLAYMDRLKRAGINEDHARAHAEAMDEALRESVATRHDVAAVRIEITAVKADLALLGISLRHEIALAVRDMTIRTGLMSVAVVTILASLKFFV